MQISTRTFDQYTKPVLVGNGVTFIILPIILVGLRFYARRVARVAIGIDDWCIVVALVNIRKPLVSCFSMTDPLQVLCTAAGVVLVLGNASIISYDESFERFTDVVRFTQHERLTSYSCGNRRYGPTPAAWTWGGTHSHRRTYKLRKGQCLPLRIVMIQICNRGLGHLIKA